MGACDGYRFSKTKNGRIGLDLHGTKLGDTVAPRLDSTFYFQGEAYVDGLMYEEALTMKDRNGRQATYFENIWIVL